MGYSYVQKYTCLRTELTEKLEIAEHLDRIDREFVGFLARWYPVLKQDRLKLNAAMSKQKVGVK